MYGTEGLNIKLFNWHDFRLVVERCTLDVPVVCVVMQIVWKPDPLFETAIFIDALILGTYADIVVWFVESPFLQRRLAIVTGKRSEGWIQVLDSYFAQKFRCAEQLGYLKLIVVR